jgi:hypothetical protein
MGKASVKAQTGTPLRGHRQRRIATRREVTGFQVDKRMSACRGPSVTSAPVAGRARPPAREVGEEIELIRYGRLVPPRGDGSSRALVGRMKGRVE